MPGTPYAGSATVYHHFHCPGMFLGFFSTESQANLIYFVFCFTKATNEVISRVPKATQTEMEEATASCAEAFKQWSETTILTRQQHVLKLQELIKRDLVSYYIKYFIFTIYIILLSPPTPTPWGGFVTLCISLTKNVRMIVSEYKHRAVYKRWQWRNYAGVPEACAQC